LDEVRRSHPRLPVLIPGIGAQGGDVIAATQLGLDADGGGILVSSSRAILYASSDPRDFAAAARSVALTLRGEINAAKAAMPAR